jgi:chromosome segregation ATPase
VIALSVLLVLVTALSAYLWVRTVRYEEYAQGVEDQGRAIGSDLATLRSQHEGTLAELAAVNEQLTTAQGRITELADEKAQVGDDREVQRQLVDYQARISQAAANVASALSTCIDAQNQLITYLGNAAAYDPADLERFKGDVQGVCATATEANTELQRQLAAGTRG